MAMANSTAPAIDIGELDIDLNVRGHGYCEYRGTRMQLEAEGIIPPGTEWKDGFSSSVAWTARGLHFWLYRRRPPGFKGQRRDYYNCDYWVLRMWTSAESGVDVELERQRRKLREMVYHRSPEGTTARAQQYKRLCNARDDIAFQRYFSAISEMSKKPIKRQTGMPYRSAHYCNGEA